MKNSFIIFLAFCGFSAYAQNNSVSKYPGRNNISIYNQYADTTISPTKIEIRGLDYSFTDFTDLLSFLDTVPDSFSVAIVEFNSMMYLPDNFFQLGHLERVQIIAPLISSIDSRFTLLCNLKAIEIVCDTLLDITRKLSKLDSIEYIDIHVHNFYPEEKLKRKVRRVIRHSKREYIYMSINWYKCWKEGMVIKCD